MIRIKPKKGKPRKPGGIKELGSPKPANNPSLISQHSKQRKPITLPKTGVKRDV
jgi:hypothetical protein